MIPVRLRIDSRLIVVAHGAPGVPVDRIAIFASIIASRGTFVNADVATVPAADRHALAAWFEDQTPQIAQVPI